MSRVPDVFWPLVAFGVCVFAWLYIEGVLTDRVIAEGRSQDEIVMPTIEVRPPLHCTDNVALQAAAQRHGDLVCAGGTKP